MLATLNLTRSDDNFLHVEERTPSASDTRANGSLWTYGYDDLDQVTSGVLAPAAGAAGLSDDATTRGYQFDTIGTKRGSAEMASRASGMARRAEPSGCPMGRRASNPVAEYIPTEGGLRAVRSYVWGLDLSESTQGAGGVGGLLATRVHAIRTWTEEIEGVTETRSATLSGGEFILADLPVMSFEEATELALSFPAYDGNGNILAYLSPTDGTPVATQTYAPFGETLTRTGWDERVLPHRFSSKPEERFGGLNYYGYRFYAAELGRWVNRDPIGERGGMNLYSMVGNNPLVRTDFLGLVEPAIASQVPIELAAKVLQVAGYGTSEIIIEFLRYVFASRMDWAGEEILRHLFNGAGMTFNRFDDPAWSDYMMANQLLTRGMQTFWRGKFLEIRRGSNSIPTQTIAINESIRGALGRDGITDFTGYGLINGANPGVEIAGKLTVLDCGNKFSGTFRYTFRDSVDPNWRVEFDWGFYAAAKMGSLGNAQTFEASFSWQSSFEFTIKPNSSSGWPF